VVADPAIAEDASLANLSKREFLDKVVTLETTRDLEFSSHVMMEGLRFKPPAAQSMFYFAKKEIKLGKYTFQEGDQLVVNIEGLAHNPAEW
jgi:cytochrome P450